MTPLDDFELVTHGPWTTGRLDTQWKLEGRTLCLQASSSLLDWIVDLTALAVPARPYKSMPEPFLVHLGFDLAYRVNADEIQALDFDRVLGYSLGGGLGLRVHEDRLWRTGRAPETVLFGCPASVMTSRPAVAARWDGVTCYRCPGDLVVEALTWFGYTHVGRQVTLGGSPTRPPKTGRIAWATGHTPSEYRQRLKHLEEQA